jgi:hypothetical protein
VDHGIIGRGISSFATTTVATASEGMVRTMAGPAGCMHPDATTDLPSATTSAATDSATTFAVADSGTTLEVADSGMIFAVADSGTDSPAPIATAAADDPLACRGSQSRPKIGAPPLSPASRFDVNGRCRRTAAPGARELGQPETPAIVESVASYPLRICLTRAIASSTACSGLMPSVTMRWIALAQTSSCQTRS